MNLIDKDKLLEALSAFRDYEHGNKHFMYGIESCREIINNQPTVRGWTLCSEKLPDNATRCLVTKIDGYVAICWYYNGWGNLEADEIIAWRPLQAPFKEES